jgi:hypothetical protein
MTGPDAGQDVFRRPAASVNVPPQMPSPGCVNTLAPWAGHLARALLQQALPRPLGARPGRRRPGTRPGTGSCRGRRSAGSRRLAARHRLRPGLAVTGLHQLDGARYLRDAQRADALLCRLVAHHSCAIIEAGERGLAGVLSREFEPAPDALSSVLTFCDMTTSPDGELVPAGQRLTEIQDRYGPGHLVSRSIQRAAPLILGAVEQVHNRAVHIA